jgi:hypothetical protein
VIAGLRESGWGVRLPSACLHGIFRSALSVWFAGLWPADCSGGEVGIPASIEMATARPCGYRFSLQQHREVVADRPAFGDTPVRQPIGRGSVPDVGARGSVEPAERASGPVMLARAELHDPSTTAASGQPDEAHRIATRVMRAGHARTPGCGSPDDDHLRQHPDSHCLFLHSCQGNGGPWCPIRRRCCRRPWPESRRVRPCRRIARQPHASDGAHAVRGRSRSDRNPVKR